MTTVVSFTDFRDNLSSHLEFLKRGNKVTIKNARNRKDVVTLVAEREEEFDWEEHIKFIKSLGGSGLLSSKEDELARKRFRDDINKRFAEARKR